MSESEIDVHVFIRTVVEVFEDHPTPSFMQVLNAPISGEQLCPYGCRAVPPLAKEHEDGWVNCQPVKFFNSEGTLIEPSQPRNLEDYTGKRVHVYDDSVSNTPQMESFVFTPISKPGAATALTTPAATNAKLTDLENCKWLMAATKVTADIAVIIWCKAKQAVPDMTSTEPTELKQRIIDARNNFGFDSTFDPADVHSLRREVAKRIFVEDVRQHMHSLIALFHEYVPTHSPNSRAHTLFMLVVHSLYSPKRNRDLFKMLFCVTCMVYSQT